MALLPPIVLQAWCGVEQRHEREIARRESAFAQTRALQVDLTRLVEGIRQLLVAQAEAFSIRDGDPVACTAYLRVVAGRFSGYALLVVTGPDKEACATAWEARRELTAMRAACPPPP